MQDIPVLGARADSALDLSIGTSFKANAHLSLGVLFGSDHAQVVPFAAQQDPVQHRLRLDFLTKFTVEHGLTQTPEDDFSPTSYVFLIVQCLRNMSRLTPLVVFRLKNLHRSIKRITRWFHHCMVARDIFIQKVIRKWYLADFQKRNRASEDSAEFQDWLGEAHALTIPPEEVDLRRPIVLYLYQRKRRAFRKKFRAFQEIYKGKQKDLCSVRCQLRGYKGEEMFLEVQLMEREDSLEKEMKQMDGQRPKFLFAVSAFSLTELQHTLKRWNTEQYEDSPDLSRTNTSSSIRSVSRSNSQAFPTLNMNGNSYSQSYPDSRGAHRALSQAPSGFLQPLQPKPPPDLPPTPSAAKRSPPLRATESLPSELPPTPSAARRSPPLRATESLPLPSCPTPKHSSLRVTESFPSACSSTPAGSSTPKHGSQNRPAAPFSIPPILGSCPSPKGSKTIR